MQLEDEDHFQHYGVLGMRWGNHTGSSNTSKSENANRINRVFSRLKNRPLSKISKKKIGTGILLVGTAMTLIGAAGVSKYVSTTGSKYKGARGLPKGFSY